MFDADAPKRLAKQLIALSAIEFVQEMFEVARAGVVRHVLTEAASRFPLRLREAIAVRQVLGPSSDKFHHGRVESLLRFKMQGLKRTSPELYTAAAGAPRRRV